MSLWGMLCFSITVSATAVMGATENIAPQQALFMASSRMTPPDFSSGKQVDIPHKWNARLFVSGWYQFYFDIHGIKKDNYAVYLPSLNMNAEVFLNGQSIGSGGRMQEPVARHWHKPLMFVFSPNLLHVGQNVLQVHIMTSTPGLFGHLGRIQVGLSANLQPAYTRVLFEKHTIYMISQVIGFLLGFLMLYLWYLRRKAEHLWFAATCLTWGISCFNITATNIPVSTRTWEVIALWVIGWLPIFISMFLYHLLQRNMQKLGRIAIAVGWIFFIILWLVPPYDIYMVTHIWQGLAIAMGVHATFSLFKYRATLSEQHQHIFQLLFSTILICFILGIHDFLVMLEILGPSSRAWLGFAIPALLIAITVILVRQFSQAMWDIEQTNEILMKKVLHAKKKMKEDYETIAALQAARAVDVERQRIYGDLHDDLGAKLLSLVYKSETDEQRLLARQAMQELRQIVKTNHAEANLDISAILLEWRQECMDRTQAHAVKFEWHEKQIEVCQLSPVVAAQLSKVLREAISNALKYGQGSCICVRVQCRCNALMMSVRNGGDIWDITAKQHGSGYHLMKKRIQDIGGFIRWRAGKRGGCHVAWSIPLGEINE